MNSHKNLVDAINGFISHYSSHENHDPNSAVMWHITHINNLPSILANGLRGRRDSGSFTDIAQIGPLHNAPDWSGNFARLFFNHNNPFYHNRKKKYKEDLVLLGFSSNFLRVTNEFAVSTHGLTYSKHLWCEVFRGSNDKRSIDEFCKWAFSRFDLPAKSAKNFWSRGKLLFSNIQVRKSSHPEADSWDCIRMAELLAPEIQPKFLKKIICSKEKVEDLKNIVVSGVSPDVLETEDDGFSGRLSLHYKEANINFEVVYSTYF